MVHGAAAVAAHHVALRAAHATRQVTPAAGAQQRARRRPVSEMDAVSAGGCGCWLGLCAHARSRRATAQQQQWPGCGHSRRLSRPSSRSRTAPPESGRPAGRAACQPRPPSRCERGEMASVSRLCRQTRCVRRASVASMHLSCDKSFCVQSAGRLGQRSSSPALLPALLLLNDIALLQRPGPALSLPAAERPQHTARDAAAARTAPLLQTPRSSSQQQQQQPPAPHHTP